MTANSNSAAEHRPWYRQFWPWFIMALPASAVVAGLTTVWIAVVNQDSVVRDDWYKDGKSINQSFARDEAAVALGMRARFTLDDMTGDVAVTLAHERDVALPDTLALALSHPTQAAADQTLILRRDAAGTYRGQLARALAGRFYLELGSDDWRLTGLREFPQATFTLDP